MNLIDSLEMKFGKNNPFFIEDVVDEKYSYDVVRKMLSNFVKEGLLKRYSQGVYYFSKKTALGESVPSFNSIIEKKYLKDKNGEQGFITGIMLLNQIGLTTQVPNTLEVVTNVEKNIKRTVFIGKRRVILRKSNYPINSENAKYLQFLDIFKYVNDKLSFEDKKKIKDYFKKQNLKIELLRRYGAISTPSVKKKIRENQIYDELTF